MFTYFKYNCPYLYNNLIQKSTVPRLIFGLGAQLTTRKGCQHRNYLWWRYNLLKIGVGIILYDTQYGLINLLRVYRYDTQSVRGQISVIGRTVNFLKQTRDLQKHWNENKHQSMQSMVNKSISSIDSEENYSTDSP